MAIKSRSILKTYFENGDKPNEDQFWDLIDSLVHVNEGGSTTNDGPTGTGVLNDITTDENGNFIFTFVGGTTINISSNGSIGVVKMPIPYVDSYDNFYFVSQEKGNDSNAVPNSYRFYKNIVTASEAARLKYDATGEKSMVYVLKGTYNEQSVNREHVDMYFEDGAVVWCEGFDQSVINDKLEAITNANVYGKGTFINKKYDPYNDQEGINFRQASSLYIEAKLVDGIQAYNNDAIHHDFANIDFIFDIATWLNKSFVFKNCRFLNGFNISSFRKGGCKEIYENCEFILPEFNVRDQRNKSLDILDYKGELIFRIEPDGFVRETNPLLNPIDVTGKTNDQILNELANDYINVRSGAWAGVSCISNREIDLNGHTQGDFKLEIRNSKCIIQKENCFGIILSKYKDSAVGEGYIVLDNILIIDETTSKDTTALITGWGGLATQQPELLINNLSHNCGSRQKLIAEGLNEWKITFDTIGNFVPKAGGTFEGNLIIGNPNGARTEINTNLNHKVFNSDNKKSIDLDGNFEGGGFAGVYHKRYARAVNMHAKTDTKEYLLNVQKYSEDGPVTNPGISLVSKLHEGDAEPISGLQLPIDNVAVVIGDKIDYKKNLGYGLINRLKTLLEEDFLVHPSTYARPIIETLKEAERITFRANNDANWYGNVHIRKNSWELRNNNPGNLTGDYGIGMTIQSSIVDNVEGSYTYFDLAPNYPQDEKVHFFSLVANRSLFTVGMGGRGLRYGYEPETNDNIVCKKAYAADFRTKKLRVLDGDAEIGGTISANEMLIDGNKLRIQTPTGYADMSSQNSNWFHFTTDRPNFYFNRGVRSNGDLGIYNKNTYMRQSDGAIFENGVRVATQTWVNAAVAAVVAANVKADDADKLDGIDSTAFARQESIPAATLKTGWYTIAINGGNRASAKFVLRETRSSRHGSIHFYAAHNYGNGNVITVLSNSWHSGGGSIRYLRLKDYSTYDGVVLQAYIDTDDAPVSGLILEDIQSSGWTPKAWVPDDTDPGGLKDYSKLTTIPAQIDLDKTLGINSSAEIFVSGNKVHRAGSDIDATDTEIKWAKNTDGAAIGFKNTGDADANSYLYFKTTDNGNEYFKWIHHISKAESATEWMQLKASGLKVLGNVESTGTYYKGEGKNIIQFSDLWLRLNPSSQFTSGIYCGTKTLRTDGQFEVGSGGANFKVDTSGNTTIKGTLVVNGNSPFLRTDADDTFTGKLSVGSTTSRQSGIYGIYDSKKTGHIWSMGTAYKIDADGSGFGNLYGFGYKHTNNTTGGTMASGHQAVWCQNGVPKAALGNNIWTAGDISANGTYYYGDSKRIIQFSDTWLRLNPSSQFTSGIYCGTKILRTDGQFEVGGSGSKFKVETNGNTTVYGNISGKSVNGAYSHLYRFGGLHFTWDSDTYGTNAQHSIKSAYGTSMGDSLTMNSYNNIRLNIDSNNNNANSKFEIGHNTSGVANVIFSVDETGNTVASGNVSAYSDRRLKKAIQPIKESFLDKIDQLKPSFYQWKDKAKEQTQQLGFIAQEVKEIFPQWVHQNDDKLSLSYDKMGAVLAVKGIQELHSEIKELKRQLKELTHGIAN